jgi:hypothetical protein
MPFESMIIVVGIPAQEAAVEVEGPMTMDAAEKANPVAARTGHAVLPRERLDRR